jgi:hypothetical protein
LSPLHPFSVSFLSLSPLLRPFLPRERIREAKNSLQIFQIGASSIDSASDEAEEEGEEAESESEEDA